MVVEVKSLRPVIALVFKMGPTNNSIPGSSHCVKVNVGSRVAFSVEKRPVHSNALLLRKVVKLNTKEATPTSYPIEDLQLGFNFCFNSVLSFDQFLGRYVCNGFHLVTPNFNPLIL